MFNTVLIPVDVSRTQETQKILAAAKALTAPWDCKIHVVSVVPDMGMAIVGSYFDKGFEVAAHEQAANELQAAVDQAGLEAETHIQTGTIYDRVIALAQALEADLIMLNAHSPELKDYLLGSNAARVVRHAKQSVMVMRL